MVTVILFIQYFRRLICDVHTLCNMLHYSQSVCHFQGHSNQVTDGPPKISHAKRVKFLLINIHLFMYYIIITNYYY